ncbi:hypothetical protein DQT32_04460 [Salmonella enterica subsp. enterica serovar Braenderup]|nr:hypothetical protein [Salmonella enterica subsp. enterica serovar Braenderup]
MATSTPFAHVSVNRFGFNVLDIRINLVGTDEPRRMAAMMVLMACGINDAEGQADHMQWVEDNYTQSITNHDTVNPNHRTFYIGTDLVSFRYEVQEDKY